MIIMNKTREWPSRVRVSVKCVAALGLACILIVWSGFGMHGTVSLAFILLSNLIVAYSIAVSSVIKQRVAVIFGMLTAILGWWLTQ